MSPCSPNDVSINIPDGPSGPTIPGFGNPFAIPLPDLNPFPAGFPEDILDLLSKLKLLIPPGALLPQLNPNFGKDVFDAIMKLLDQFMPFLMLYKFFLPILELIICIIEVLCALMNPFKLIRALNRLFTQCIPNFLNLFPIFALIIMIISLLLLIIALIEYIISQIIKFILIILRNIIALDKAIEDADSNAIKSIALKLGSLLCIFQNLFVLFAIFNIIIQIIRDILSLVFSIPPCEDGDPSNEDGCCTPDVCPTIIKTPYTQNTGTFRYLNAVTFDTGLAIPGFPNVTSEIRAESWQIYDVQQTQSQEFRNIFDAFDVTILPKPVFFPTDAVYNATTEPKQAPYLMDLEMLYDPSSWGRGGSIRTVIFKKCIMTHVPTTTLYNGLTNTDIPSAVALIAGGLGYELDGTPLTGFAADGTTPIADQATLENFFHMAAQNSVTPVLSDADGYTFINMTYTFNPNIAPLLTKNLVTLGCVPSIALNRTFLNNIFTGDIAFKTQRLGAHVNGPNFPNPGAAQACLTNALTDLRTNMTVAGVAAFQATANICLNKLRDDVNTSLGEMVAIGFDPCKSVASLNINTQFTSKPIVVTVDINERNGHPLTAGLSTTVAADLATRIQAFPTFGTVGDFQYDGYQSFVANLTSDLPGSGSVMVAFDNNTFCTNDLPAVGSSGDAVPTHSLQELLFQFVYTPVGPGVPSTGEPDSDGTQPRRDAGDQSGQDGI